MIQADLKPLVCLEVDGTPSWADTELVPTPHFKFRENSWIGFDFETLRFDERFVSAICEFLFALARLKHQRKA